MNAHALSYPSLQRRLIADRRARALFLPRTTQHLQRSSSPFKEIGRAAMALAAATAWALLLLLAAA